MYSHCKGNSQNLEYEKAKVTLKRSSVELYNSHLRQILKGPGQVVAHGWVQYLVLHQTEPCNLAERLKNKLGYMLISYSSTVEEVRWLPREDLKLV
jgi:hypothetical protein